jgi:hypothetical protein
MTQNPASPRRFYHLSDRMAECYTMWASKARADTQQLDNLSDRC